jgi:hypothetical protein
MAGWDGSVMCGRHDGHVLTTRAEAPMVAECSCGELMVATLAAGATVVEWHAADAEYADYLTERCRTSQCYRWAQVERYQVGPQDARLSILTVGGDQADVDRVIAAVEERAPTGSW